jgi:putative peptide maturation dehydrogenase
LERSPYNPLCAAECGVAQKSSQISGGVTTLADATRSAYFARLPEHLPMKIRRCAILLIEPREKLAFSLNSLCNGGDGLDARIELLALAPHLDAEVPVSAVEVAVLNALVAAPWREFDELAPQHGAAILQSLLAKGLLIGDDDAHVAVRASDEALRAANWHTHSAVSHYLGRWRGVTSGEDLAKSGVYTMSELFARLGAPPPHVLERVPASERIGLPQPVATPVDEILARRATCRNFDPARFVEKSTFAHILRRVFGAQEYKIHDDNIVIKRTSPSGGGLHPTEAYVVAQRVEGVAPGLYHYHALEHALEPLPPPAEGLPEFVRIMVAAQKYFLDAPVFVVLATRFPRTFWKYRNHTKAYRATIFDAGHLSQTLYVSATEFGLGAFITAAINEVDIERALGLDPLKESPLAVLGFGHRAGECATFEFDPARKVWPNGVPAPE